MPAYIVGYETPEELAQIQSIIADVLGPLADIVAAFAEAIGIRAPTVLPILREVLLPNVPTGLIDQLLNAIPTLRYAIESRQVSFDVSYHPATLSPGASLEWGLEKIGIAGTNLTGRGVKVAIIDTGLDMSHPDFADRPNTIFMDERSKTDVGRHGTFVAGVLAGPVNPVTPPRYGVAPQVTLCIANVTDKGGVGSNELNLQAGVEWALRQGCQLINLSWEIKFDPTRPTSFLESRGEAAIRQGCLVVAAGGNFTDRAAGTFVPVTEPGHAQSILAIGSIDKDTFKISGFSPRSDGTPGGQVDFVAPGDQIRSSVPKGVSGEIYKISSATSFSTPMVTGLAALHLENGVLAHQLLEKLKQRTMPASADPRDAAFGLPLVP